jgi:predicted lipoprotein with Yx(FWY)xxD motif
MKGGVVTGFATSAVLLLAACSAPAAGLGYGDSPGASATTAPASIKTASSALGTILVDGNGRSLYLFEADTGSTSTCSGPCATAWPPELTTGAAVAADGVNSASLGTSPRGDGTTMVTYAGHPLYRFVGDTKPGDTKGQGINQFGGGWYVVSPRRQSRSHRQRWLAVLIAKTTSRITHTAGSVPRHLRE